MPRTRSVPAAKSEPKQTEQTPKPLTPEAPCKTFILPSSASDNARLLSLPNPQSGDLTRYFFCPDRGVYEFTVVAPPSQPGRSILFTPCTEKPSEDDDAVVTPKATVAKKAELLIATPIDTIFFMIPLLAPSSKSGPSLFQPLDDIIDSQDDLPPHLRHVLYDETFRPSLLSRVEAICDTVEAGDEKLFRFSEMKLVRELIGKAERMVAHGLPASLEERFVRQALATPLMAVKREDIVTSQTSSNESESGTKSEERPDSPSTVATTATPSVSTPAGESTPAPQPPGVEDSAPSDPVARLLRISTALAFIKESYLLPPLCTRLDEILASPESPLDLKPLTERLKEIADLRAEAMASRNMSDFTRKRGLDDDEEAETRAEKKRKKEEEEKKNKAAESRGVRDLKKVNTTGMKKMSDFFGKAAAKKKS
ncbi:hypothetical protein N7474_009484 [Penicillium riverlandense]|uniref:uncharacterized protein n=1 Tax=Penicillium riverlandense TaxID=1903569 RepID=UPI002547FF5E|nr:uncharacterized protein N7474_009484 [Penicillium riverlandense]KAJ5808215.1 hypothetical protein N7474_009484 [Penicillium riverlandense]